MFYTVAIYTILPKNYNSILVSMNWPVLIYSRGSQIIESYTLQHTGAQSIVTNGLNLIGGIIRIFTTLSEIGYDIPILTGFALSTTLNSIIVLQHFVYSKNTEQFKLSLLQQQIIDTKTKKVT